MCTASHLKAMLLNTAIKVSQRGVVFFRSQNDLDDNLQKSLEQRLGQLSGKPSSSGLHIHPVINSGREGGSNDDEVSVISSKAFRKIYKDTQLDASKKKQSGKDGWHSDITFEPVPSDYAILRLVELPGTGGGRPLFPAYHCVAGLKSFPDDRMHRS